MASSTKETEKTVMDKLTEIESEIKDQVAVLDGQIRELRLERRRLVGIKKVMQPGFMKPKVKKEKK